MKYNEWYKNGNQNSWKSKLKKEINPSNPPPVTRASTHQSSQSEIKELEQIERNMKEYLDTILQIRVDYMNYKK